MDFVDSYKELFGVRRFTARAKLKSGTVVQFTYDGEQKYAMVLNPEWEGKMHALSLKSLSPDGLKTLLKELSDEDNADAIYSKYKTSTYTETRPYRTYSLSKIRSLREIYLKELTPLSTPKPSPKAIEVEPKEVKRYGLYEE